MIFSPVFLPSMCTQVQTGSREDLMNDYFTRGTRPAAPRDGAKTPTNYVTPTVKTPSSSAAPHKPGQSVKPSIRQPANEGCHSQTLPNRGSGALSGARPSPRAGLGAAGNGGTSSSLSRTFSLASADLLRSNGPESYRSDHSYMSPANQSEVVLRRGGGGVARERPLSARLASSSPLLGDGGHLDPRRLSVAPPRDELSLPPPQHHSSSLSLQPERYGTSGGSRQGGGTGGGGSSGTPRTPAGQSGRPTPQRHQNNTNHHHHHHRGEVAMVTPVRAVSALRLEEEEVGEERRDRGELRQAESPLLKKGETGGPSGGGVNGGTEERPKSTPASPDPTNDPQTVWYEYGCV